MILLDDSKCISRSRRLSDNLIFTLWLSLSVEDGEVPRGKMAGEYDRCEVGEDEGGGEADTWSIGFGGGGGTPIERKEAKIGFAKFI